MNRISQNGLELLKEWEGTGPYRNGRYQSYKDVAGYETIGVGHLLSQQELQTGVLESIGVNWHNGIDEQQMIALLDADCNPAEQAVNQVQVQLNQNQFDALVIFVFNIGVSAFLKSTLLRVLNAGQYDQVPIQLMRWSMSGGVQVQGLVNRRQHEITLWQR